MMVPIKGILVSSLESGILIFSEAFAPNYGFNETVGADAMQLSSALYALYRLSMNGESGEETNETLTHIRQGNLSIYFSATVRPDHSESFLTILCADHEMDSGEIKSLLDRISLIVSSMSISTAHSPRISTLKVIRNKLHQLYYETLQDSFDMLIRCSPKMNPASPPSKISVCFADALMRDSETSPSSPSPSPPLPLSVLALSLVKDWLMDHTSTITEPSSSSSLSSSSLSSTSISPRYPSNGLSESLISQSPLQCDAVSPSNASNSSVDIQEIGCWDGIMMMFRKRNKVTVGTGAIVTSHNIEHPPHPQTQRSLEFKADVNVNINSITSTSTIADSSKLNTSSYQDDKSIATVITLSSRLYPQACVTQTEPTKIISAARRRITEIRRKRQPLLPDLPQVFTFYLDPDDGQMGGCQDVNKETNIIDKDKDSAAAAQMVIEKSETQPVDALIDLDSSLLHSNPSSPVKTSTSTRPSRYQEPTQEVVVCVVGNICLMLQQRLHGDACGLFDSLDKRHLHIFTHWAALCLSLPRPSAESPTLHTSTNDVFNGIQISTI